mmetsp:Transcript_156074/g.500568  ORF Transcript_156074/g.500568 Transcript_156074/m.500568 type:complete len:847 (-) Transcript_156074:275-2815(-)
MDAPTEGTDPAKAVVGRIDGKRHLSVPIPMRLSDGGQSGSPAPWREKMKDSLYEAQVALLEKTNRRRSCYINDPSSLSRALPAASSSSAAAHNAPFRKTAEDCTLPERHVKGPASCATSTHTSPANGFSGHNSPLHNSSSRAVSVDEEAVTERRTFSTRGRANSLQDTQMLKNAKFLKLTGTKGIVNRGMAYMGVDWFTLDSKKQRISWLFIVQHMYFWCYAGYIVSVILIGAFLIWATEPEDGLDFMQSLYTAASCVSQSGLAVADWSQRANSTYIISFCLILLGSAPLLLCVPVILRESSFRMQAKMTRAMQRKDSGVMDSMGQQPTCLRRSNSDPCFGKTNGGNPTSPSNESTTVSFDRSEFVAALKLSPSTNGSSIGTVAVAGSPSANGSSGTDSSKKVIARRQTMNVFKSASLHTFDQEISSAPEMMPSVKAVVDKPVKNCCSASLPEAYRLEYKSLRVVLKVVLGYWLFAHMLGFAIFFSYFQFFEGAIQDKFFAEGLTPWCHALYLTVSSFQNNGLVMTPSSVMDFANSPVLLNTVGLLIFLGNVGLPIMVRLIVTILNRQAAPGSQRQQVLDFLLEHPRRCFTHMFPAVHTLWLLLVVIALNVMTTSVILWQDRYSPAMINLTSMNKFWNALFQSVSARTAGLNSVNIAFLSQASTFFLCVMMYLATTPTVVTMRLSAVVGKRGKAELDITGRAEGIEEAVLTGDDSLQGQARRYLTQDVTYLTMAMFLICCWEKDQFVRSAKDISPDSDGIYGDFTFFKVLFEIASAYGTCGLSLGYQDQTASFSAVWSTQSQVVLVLVMILGRLRGLPDSIDPSVRVAMEDHNMSAADQAHRFIHA